MSKISVFGLGYVGAVTTACLAKDGHHLVGVDPNPVKIGAIAEGRSPILEEGTDELIAAAAAQGRLEATSDPAEAVARTEISLICVGTPSQLNGNLDLRYVRRVCEQIGRALAAKSRPHLVVCRSTILPGSMRGIVIPTLEEYSGKRAGVDFDVCNNPEFLREGTAVYDYYHPPKIVIGQTRPAAGDAVAALYQGIDAPLIQTDLETAEMVKYVDNVWHALKVCYANEIGRFCRAAGLDARRVMDVFCQDQKLNLSALYLKPGFAFGGSCLPKDVRALVYKSRQMDCDTPMVNSILPSNSSHISHAFDLVASTQNKQIGILGLAFKAGTDDLRESPMLELVERLLGKGYQVLIYDPNVRLERLLGTNRDYVLNTIPHIAPLLAPDAREVVEFAETVVIGNHMDAYADALKNNEGRKTVVDLVGIMDRRSEDRGYKGICW